MQLQEYTLPNICFLDGHGPEGDHLKNRTVILHTPTMTLVEVVALDEILVSNFKTKTKSYQYKNFAGITENHLLAVHIANPEKYNEDILDQVWNWYEKYLDWEDQNIIIDEQSKFN